MKIDPSVVWCWEWPIPTLCLHIVSRSEWGVFICSTVCISVRGPRPQRRSGHKLTDWKYCHMLDLGNYKSSLFLLLLLGCRSILHWRTGMMWRSLRGMLWKLTTMTLSTSYGSSCTPKPFTSVPCPWRSADIPELSHICLSNEWKNVFIQTRSRTGT